MTIDAFIIPLLAVQLLSANAVLELHFWTQRTVAIRAGLELSSHPLC